MNLIDGTVNLADYIKTADLTAKVMPAGEFLAAVKAEFAPKDGHKRYPTMLAGKAVGWSSARVK